MQKLLKAFKSRTFWTIAVLVVINSVSAIHQYIPVDYVGYVDMFLGILATYFKVNPSQEY